MNNASPVQVGDVLAGKYQVERVLGVGGMGIVVAARHMHLDQRVALKFMLPHVLGNAEAVARFLREARAAVRITSQHVAKILDTGTLENGAPYIVMEYLDGRDLSRMLAERGRIPASEAADYMLEACEALAEAHSLGIIHRDLKPANLYLANLAGGTVVKVLDFGISKALMGADNNMTQTSSILGSPAYMSPEQMRSSKAVDARADIWSLGVILYEAVSGRVPFQGESFTDLALKIMTERLPPLAATPGLAPGFEAVIMRCLDKDPARRYGSIAKLAAALAPFASAKSRPLVERIHGILRESTGPVEKAENAGAPTKIENTVSVQPLEPPSRRSRVPLIAGAVAVAAAIGVTVALVIGGGGSSAKEAPPAAASPVAVPPPVAAPAPAAPTPAAPTPPPEPTPVKVATPPPVAPTPAPPAAAALPPDAAPPPEPRPPAPAHVETPPAPPPEPVKPPGPATAKAPEPATAKTPTSKSTTPKTKRKSRDEAEPTYDENDDSPKLTLPERTVPTPPSP